MSDDRKRLEEVDFPIAKAPVNAVRDLAQHGSNDG